MEEIKYILTDEKTNVNGRTVYRIQAIKDFGDVKAGDLGGWIENEFNLDQKDTCWAHPDAFVFEDALIRNHAQLHKGVVAYENCVITGQAVLEGRIQVYDHAYIYGECKIKNTNMHSYMRISGNVRINSDTEILANALTLCKESFNEHAKIHSEADYLCVGPIGSRYDYTTFYRTKDLGIWVCCGCFNGPIDEFKKKVKQTHPFGSQFRIEYTDAVRIAKTKLTKIKLSPSDML